MKDLLTYIVKGILGSDDFTVEESMNEDKLELTVFVPKEMIGLVIGKQGAMIKAIRNLLRVKATLDGTFVYVNVEEK